jgi:hypothetical protein
VLSALLFCSETGLATTDTVIVCVLVIERSKLLRYFRYTALVSELTKEVSSVTFGSGIQTPLSELAVSPSFSICRPNGPPSTACLRALRMLESAVCEGGMGLEETLSWIRLQTMTNSTHVMCASLFFARAYRPSNIS